MVDFILVLFSPGALRCDILYLFSNIKVSSEDNEKSWVTYQDTQLAKEKNYKALGQPGRMQL